MSAVLRGKPGCDLCDLCPSARGLSLRRRAGGLWGQGPLCRHCWYSQTPGWQRRATWSGSGSLWGPQYQEAPFHLICLPRSASWPRLGTLLRASPRCPKVGGGAWGGLPRTLPAPGAAQGPLPRSPTAATRWTPRWTPVLILVFTSCFWRKPPGAGCGGRGSRASGLAEVASACTGLRGSPWGGRTRVGPQTSAGRRMRSLGAPGLGVQPAPLALGFSPTRTRPSPGASSLSRSPWGGVAPASHV